MIKIYKISKGSPIDFAAEELKKYFRMMMPECNDIEIDYDPSATEGFRLGLLADFGIDVEVEDERFDDYLYAKCDECGGIIAGINARSVLIAVYEYLRQNGLRWLYPGPDGEYIPVKDITSVSFKIKPSCRYRGFANTTAASYQTNLEFIDFLPKIGMNTFMVEFKVPVFYTDNYYSHKRNNKNRPPERVTNSTILQWKRATECEAAKRGLGFHDVGHGFCVDSFGIDSNYSWFKTDDSVVPEETRKFLAMVGGKRGLYEGVPANTNFCMSNPEARKRFSDYVADYASGHSNVDLLHVWLADCSNNHCECDECVKRSPSDWYVILLNEIDKELSRRNIKTKIVFLIYVETLWAPKTEVIENPDRFVLMFAPFARYYYDSITKGEIPSERTPYIRNKTSLPKTLEEYVGHYTDWRKLFSGKSFSFDYHFCWSEYHDLSTLKYSKLIYDEIKYYKSIGIDGIVEDGDMRAFLPNGLQLYTLARTLFDTSLTYEEILEDYLSSVYGEAYPKFKEVLIELENAISFKYLSKLDSKNSNVSLFYNPEIAKNIETKLPNILKRGREIVKEYFDSPIRVQTVSVRLFEHYLDLIEGLGRVIKEKALANDERAAELYYEFETEFGKRECEIERYFNQCFFFNNLDYIVFGTKSNTEFLG